MNNLKVKQPLITVITVVFNDVNNLEATILSVINQTYPNLEYIIIDGNSTDGTVDIIKKYSNKISYWISEPDKGIYDAMNKGIKKATGEWVNFMNSGDTFASNNVIQEIFNNSISEEKKVIYGSVMLIENGTKRLRKPDPINYMSRHIPFCHQASFTKLDKLYFDITYRIAADFKMFYDIYKTYGKNAFLSKSNIIFAIYECENGVSIKQERTRYYEYLKIRSHSKDFYWYYEYVKGKINDLFRRW